MSEHKQVVSVLKFNANAKHLLQLNALARSICQLKRIRIIPTLLRRCLTHPEQDIEEDEHDAILNFDCTREAARERLTPWTRHKYDLFMGLMARLFMSQSDLKKFVIDMSCTVPLPTHEIARHLDYEESKKVKYKPGHYKPVSQSYFNSNDDIPVYLSADDADAGPVYQPSSPTYSREGSASPEKSQEKSPAGSASRGGSPGARNDADVPLEEESAVNKHANILSDAREAQHEIVHVDSDPEGPSKAESPHTKAGGNLNPAVETRQEKLDRLQREMQALIEQEDEQPETLPNSSSSVVPEPPKMNEARRTPPPSSPSKSNGKAVLSTKGMPEGSSFTAAQAASNIDHIANASAAEEALHAEHASPPAKREQPRPQTAGPKPQIVVPAVRDVIAAALHSIPKPANNSASKSAVAGEQKDMVRGGQTIIGSAGNGNKILGKRISTEEAAPKPAGKTPAGDMRVIPKLKPAKTPATHDERVEPPEGGLEA